MKTITQITLPGGLDVDVLFENGKLAYTFEYEGENYGTSVKLPSKKVQDIASACLILFTSALETKQELSK